MLKMSITILLLHGLQVMNSQQGIAYLSNASGNFDLFWSKEDGSARKQLTQNKGWDWSPLWNEAEAAFIYNSSDSLGNFAILKIALDGTIDSLDTKGKDDYVLSPQGNRFLYTLKDGDNRYIGCYDLVKENNRLLVTAPSYNGRMKWSPDGEKFSFISDRDGNNELYVYSMKDQKEKRLSDTPKSEKYASWMPDSKTIVYTYHYSDERNNEHNDIFRVDIESGKVSQITNDEKFYLEIAVSPDGEKIAFHAKREEGDQIYIMNLDGSEEMQLTFGNAYHGEPAWSRK